MKVNCLKKRVFPLCLSFVLLGAAMHPLAANEDSGESLPQIKVELLKYRINPNSNIRVKIFPHDRDYKPHGQDQLRTAINLKSDGLCHVFEADPNKAAKTRKALYASRQIEVNLKTLSQAIWVECDQAVTVQRESHLPAFTYTGGLYIHKVGSGEKKYLEVINVLRLVDYLKGVVPTEVYPDWPMETLKTQAVAARTYAVFHYIYSQRYARSRYWDVDDTIAYQAYTGISLRTPRTDQAVKETEGQILLHGGEVIQAYYHADSAGRTESAWNVWRNDVPYVAPIQEFFLNDQAPSLWSKDISLRKLTRKLRAARVLAAKEEVVGLSVPVIGRTESDRVRLITLALKDGGFKNIPINVFRRAVGSLPSTLFTFEPDEKLADTVWLRGQGSGHGVGMSQRGAAYLAASKGWTYDRILDFYYMNTALCRLGSGKGETPDCYELAKQHEAEKLALQQQNAS